MQGTVAHAGNYAASMDGKNASGMSLVQGATGQNMVPPSSMDEGGVKPLDAVGRAGSFNEDNDSEGSDIILEAADAVGHPSVFDQPGSKRKETRIDI